MAENPEMSEADAKSLAASQVDAEIARIYNKNDAGKYVETTM
jgi:hypothetical protein